MRKIIMFLFFILAVTPVSLSQTKTDLYLGGGLGFPASPKTFTDYWKMGYYASGGIGFSITDAASVIFSVEYGSFPIDDSRILSIANIPSSVSASIDGGTAQGLTAQGNIKLRFNNATNSVVPYVVAGAGYFNLSFTDVTVRASYLGSIYTMTIKNDNESAFSTSFGAGVDIPAGETMDVFVEGRYFIAFTQGESTGIIPVRAGVRIGL